MTRDEANALLRQYTTLPHLIKHSLAVEAALRGYAQRLGEDEELWAVTGLLHDFDYEMHPEPHQHPALGKPILEEQGVPDAVIHAIQAHADYLEISRTNALDKALYAVDELSGFVMAVAMVRPSRSLHEVDVRAVKKKLKDKAFARAVSREDIQHGAEDLGVPLDEHIGHVVASLQAIAPKLDLDGANTGR
ncbi:MAG: HDIG domain-containing protein [Chloroflexia bacterium]|nr:HDIG domain-containing protein [Chloroflexia bacterium]